MNNVPGGPQASSVAFVGISQFNICTFTDIVDAFASPVLPTGAFQIDKKLNTATLNTSADAFDIVSNSTVSVQLNLTGLQSPVRRPVLLDLPLCKGAGAYGCRIRRMPQVLCRLQLRGV
jgi:hypothetical protein